MAKLLQIEGAPVREPVTGPRGLLSFDWERWFHRMPDWILKRPSCHVYRTTTQAIVTATETDVLFDAEDHDNAGFHSTSSNTDRITIPEDGVYCFGAHLIWESNAVGFRYMNITLNDPAPSAAAARLIHGARNAANEDPNGAMARSGIRELSAGDILRFSVQHSRGSNLNVLGVTATGPQANGFWCFKVSK